MKFILLAILALSVTASHQNAINATNQEEIKTLGYISNYNAAPKGYAYEPQARPAYNYNQMPYNGEPDRPYYQEPYRQQTIIYEKTAPTPEPPKPPTEFDLTCASQYSGEELSTMFVLSNTTYTFDNVYELIFANTGCILLSSSELVNFYIPKANSAGSLVLHFRCTSNDKNLFNIADQSLQLSKRQKCNKMLCDLTGDSCGFYDINEIRRLIQVNGCEGKSLTITCPAYTKIRIINANYGRTDKTTCAAEAAALGYGYPELTVTNCFYDATATLISKCNDKKTCNTDVNNDVFEDNCEGTYKYLQVEYACV